MSDVRFGSESEFVKITFPSSYTEEGWGQAEVEIAVKCFGGLIRPYLRVADVAAFTIALRKLYETLKGSAAFRPLEDQFSLQLEGTTGGGIHVTGHAWSRAVCGNKLQFELELDQSYLREPLQALEKLTARPGA